MDLWLWLLVAAAGAAGQFLDVVAGMGFGALSSTLLLAGGVSPVTVVATISIAKIGSGLVSGLSHWHAGNVRRDWIWPLLLPAVVGAVAAALLVAYAPKGAIRITVPFLLLLMGLLILRRALSKNIQVPAVAGGSPDAPIPLSARLPVPFAVPRLPKTLGVSAVGLVGGVMNGLSGAFGPFTTSSLLLIKKGHPRYVVGTVNFVEFFVALAVAFTLLPQMSKIDIVLPAALVVGALITSPLGARLAKRLDARFLALLIALTLVGLNLWSIAVALT
ncbi:MAG: sulfite exporter TauE/SafE family protein [SAR202 cluster bacterium]|nr:sulfite exporter TauE/SafE family protein [SAR202 cluster bacterium]